MSPRRRRVGSPRWPPPRLPEDPVALSRAAVESARQHGFVAAGVLQADRPLSWPRFRAWLDAGRHGGMAWLERDAEARARVPA